MLESLVGEGSGMKVRLAKGWLLVSRLMVMAATLGGVALLVGFARKSGY